MDFGRPGLWVAKQVELRDIGQGLSDGHLFMMPPAASG
jgi:hypothetical protein